MRFSLLQQVPPDEAPFTRTFKGTGTSQLPVPDLIELKGVKVNGEPLALTEAREVPKDGTLSEIMVQEFPMVLVDTNERGIPYLIRSSLSNHGIWQDGAPITVVGEWAERSARAAMPTKTAAGGRD